MEEDILKNVECGICQQILTEPKQLKCGHVFCRLCIDESFTKNRVNQYNGYNCPLCRTQTVLTAAGAKELNDASFELKRIIEIVKKRSGSGFLQEYKDIVKSEKSKCSKHPKEKVEFLCQCSLDPFCKLCKEEHENHVISSSSKVLGEMTKMVEEIEAKITSVRNECTIVTDCLKTLDISRTKTESDLESAFRKLEKEKEKIKRTLNESYNVEKTKLLHTQENLSKSLKSAIEIRERLSNILTFGIHGHTLSSWKKLQVDNEQLNRLRQEELNLRKCIYKFIPGHANSLKLGRIQKTKARRRCYVLMQQNENEENLADDSEEDEWYEDVVSDYTSEEESSQAVRCCMHITQSYLQKTHATTSIHGVQNMYEDDVECVEQDGICIPQEEYNVNEQGTEDLYESDPGPCDSENTDLPIKERKKVVAEFDYDATDDDELDLKEDDIIYITNEMGQGWWEGTLNGRTGLFPANYVKPFQESEAAGTLKDTDRGREVPNEYKPNGIDERKVQGGDISEEVKEETEDRHRKVCDSRTDMFPNIHTENLEEEKANEATGNHLDCDNPPPIPERLYKGDLSKPIHDRPPMPAPRTDKDTSVMVPRVPIDSRPPMPLPIDSSEETTRVKHAHVSPRIPSGSQLRVNTSREGSTIERPRILKKDIKISGGTILKRNLLMLCSHDESKVLIEDLTNENNSISKSVNGVWDAAAESSAEFAFVSKLAKKDTKKGSSASIVKIDKNGEEREVFTYHVKDPMGLAYAQDKLFVCEPSDKKVVVFCTKSKEKLGSIKYEGFKCPWFVYASNIEDVVFISDYKAGKIFRVKNSTKDVRGFMEPKLYTKTPQFIPGKCTCLADKVYVCDQNEKCIKCLSYKYETLYVVKACHYRPFLIFNNGTETGELVIVSLNGDIEFFKV